MKHPLLWSTMVALIMLVLGSRASAVDVYEHQPNIRGAYNKLLAVLTQLDKAKLEEPGPHIKNAVLELDNAKTFLEQATNNKGTYIKTAKDLCDQAKTVLETTPPDIDKATEIANRALHEVNMAGKAGQHR